MKTENEHTPDGRGESARNAHSAAHGQHLDLSRFVREESVVSGNIVSLRLASRTQAQLSSWATVPYLIFEVALDSNAATIAPMCTNGPWGVAVVIVLMLLFLLCKPTSLPTGSPPPMVKMRPTICKKFFFDIWVLLFLLPSSNPHYNAERTLNNVIFWPESLTAWLRIRSLTLLTPLMKHNFLIIIILNIEIASKDIILNYDRKKIEIANLCKQCLQREVIVQHETRDYHFHFRNARTFNKSLRCVFMRIDNSKVQ